MKPNVPAFPIAGYGGLTKREFMATMALQGIISTWPSEIAPTNSFAKIAVAQADSLIKELSEEK